MRTGAQRWTEIGVMVPVAVGYAWFATALRPFTLPSLAAVLAGGLVGVFLGAAIPGPRTDPPPTPAPNVPRGSKGWVGLGAALGLWELASFLQHPRAAHPTLSSRATALFHSHPARALGLLLWFVAAACLAARLRRSRVGRPLVLLTWLWLGWHLFVRSSYR
jgi:hypothetical protein